MAFAQVYVSIEFGALVEPIAPDRLTRLNSTIFSMVSLLSGAHFIADYPVGRW
jgi:hypothetical protein